MKQVTKTHYDFEKYVGLDRWSSYWYQLNETIKLKPKSVLEIGNGSKIIKTMLEEEGINYESVDIAKDLNPDHVGDIRYFNIYKSYDIVMACQVLEHIHYNNFNLALINLKKHSNKYVIISLPIYGAYVKFQLRVPFININITKKLKSNNKFKFNGEHYWELNTAGYSFNRIRQDITEHYNILKEFKVPENPYHYFFILEVRI